MISEYMFSNMSTAILLFLGGIGFIFGIILLYELLKLKKNETLKPQFAPSWEDAPWWANYLAQDKSGQFWWYSTKPVHVGDEWFCSDGIFEQANVIGWKDSLVSRIK